MIVGDICFKNIVEMLSNPQDALFGRLSIILETYCSSTRKVNLYNHVI